MLRAVLIASATCGTLFALINILFDLTHGWGFGRLRMHLMFATGVALLVALIGAAVQWPLLRAMRTLSRRFVITIGAVLALIPIAALVAILRDRDEESIGEILLFWLHVPGEFVISFLPMAAAGAIIAWFATAGSPSTR